MMTLFLNNCSTAYKVTGNFMQLFAQCNKNYKTSKINHQNSLSFLFKALGYCSGLLNPISAKLFNYYLSIKNG